jgi:chemotaxis protein MotB
MKTRTSFLLALPLGLSLAGPPSAALAEDAAAVSFGEAAQAFAAGAIQKFTPRDGTVNLITGDNQTTGNRMLLGKADQLYLKLDHPAEAAVGDLFTIYRRVRKVFHPKTREYLGFVTIRVAVVRVLQADHDLTTVEIVRSYGSVSPGDLVVRYSPAAAAEPAVVADQSEISGMIVELQADKTMTLLAQGDVVYVDRGSADGLKPGDLMDLYRRTTGLPPRKIGYVKVLATEEHTASVKVMRSNTRVLQGDSFRFTGASSPLLEPVDPAPRSSQAIPAKAEVSSVPSDLVASKLKIMDAAGESRINLGELPQLLRYDSGEAVIKAESYKVLDQLIEYLRTSGDQRLIRVEGHTDNVEIGPSLKSRYPTNWDLSKARASGVVRYLVEKGSVDSARLSSVGYGDTRPAATNSNEDGRTKNRRVEILLHAPQTDSQPSSGDALPSQASMGTQLSATEARSTPVAPENHDAGAGTLSLGKPDPPGVTGENPAPGPADMSDPAASASSGTKETASQESSPPQ